MDHLSPLCIRLGHHFNDLTLLEMALTHRSMGAMNNERLEFLGDSLLNLIIAEKLYREYPNLTEGELSRLRANLVKGETLAILGKELLINEYLRLGIGEIRSGGAERKSILANTIEAIIGAIYLDSNLEACRERVLTWFADRLDAISFTGVQKDPKTQLQEYLQSKKLALPEYIILSIKGEAHSQIFHVECRVRGLKQVSVGFGTSRRRAEQDAAQKFLQTLSLPL